MKHPLSGCAASPFLCGRGTTPSLRGGPGSASLVVAASVLTDVCGAQRLEGWPS